MNIILLVLLVTTTFYGFSEEMTHSERLIEEKKCQTVCKVMQLEHQCNQCNTRMPIRFGKRSSEIELKLHTFLNAHQLSEEEYFMQMLLKRFLPSESNMFNLHLSTN